MKNAPHTAAEVAWPELDAIAYTRAQAAYPLPCVAAQKYWPPVKRVDNVYGDRNLICSCAPLESLCGGRRIGGFRPLRRCT